MKTYLPLVTVGICLIVFAIITCSSGGDSTGPGYTAVDLNGEIEFVSQSGIDLDSVEIGFGNSTTTLDSSENFTITGNQGVPGLMIATDLTDSVPLLMSVIADPRENMTNRVNLRSTALALVYLNPMVCLADAEACSTSLEMIEDLPEFTTLENLLSSKLASDPKALATEDQQIQQAVVDVVLAYFEEFPDVADTNLTLQKERFGKLVNLFNDGTIISPVYSSGHQIKHKSGTEFEVTNAYGRWASMLLPNGTKKLLPPNGTMFDFIKDGVPWAPSTTKFNLTVPEGADTQRVHIYGFGFNSDADNLWDNLDDDEKDMAITAGGVTIIFEFCGHILSLYGNSKSFDIQTGLKQSYDDHWGIQLLSFITGDVKFMADITKLIKQKKYGELFYTFAKQVLYKFAYDPAYREFWLKQAGYTFSEEALGRLTGLVVTPAVSAPVMGVMIGNNLTSVAKTWTGLTSSRFKTSFKIWKEIGDFGNVTGGVYDKDNGTPIKGATVNLLGDDQNPIDTWHSYTTDEDGGFYFENITVGEKTLQATKTGYNAGQADVTIVKNRILTKNIEMEKIAATVEGRILNEVKIGNDLSDSLFTKEVNLRIREVGGENRSESYYEADGQYSLRVSPGTWYVVVEHEDYYNDSVKVTVTEDKVMKMDDLVLKPILSMSIRFYVDMDFDGSYESQYNIDFERISFSKVVDPSQSGLACPTGSSADIILIVAEKVATEDLVTLIINLDKVRESDYYNLGSISDAVCRGTNMGGTAVYITSRFLCTESDGSDTDPMFFGWPAGPYYNSKCKCGVGNMGNMVFTSFGNNITDKIEGAVTATLPGWANCECEPIDTDGDGTDDDWEVVCAKAYMDIEIKGIVGTEYMMQETAKKNFGPLDSHSILQLISSQK